MSRIDDIVVAIAPVYLKSFLHGLRRKQGGARMTKKEVIDAIVDLAHAIDTRLADTELADAKSVPICPHAPHTFWTIPESVAIWYNAETRQCRHCGVKIQHVE
jgi:phage-related holin